MMGNFKTFWIFGFEWWGGLRPEKMWDRRGRCFRPLFGGIWIRVKERGGNTLR